MKLGYHLPSAYTVHFTNIICKHLSPPHEVGLIHPILQLRKLRLKKGEKFTQVLTAGRY